MNLNDLVSTIPGVGLFFEKKLKKLNIQTIEDLLYHLPNRYIDYSLTTDISSIQEGEIVTLKGSVKSIKNIYIKGKKLTIQKAVVADKTGEIQVTWFNQPYLVKNLAGKYISLSGKITRFGKHYNLESPEYELSKEETIHTGGLIPVYPETNGISSKWLRAKIDYLLSKLSEINDPIPQTILQKANLIGLEEAFKKIHQPKNKSQIEEARKRLAFDELFYLQLQSLIRKKEWQKEKVGKKLAVFPYLSKIQEFIKNLPFRLTNSQKKAAKEILADLSKPIPMNRLLQGDVGCGKTVVSAIAIYLAFLNGYNSVFMAPTEILAQQHFQTLSDLLKPLGLTVGLETQTNKLKEEKNVIVGTHALLYNKKPFKNVALVIIDEQHRFGVEQRARLRSLGLHPHLLTMTATPIPRTIALTLYGELDLSTITEMPQGRKIVKTFVVPPEKYEKAFEWIKNKIKKSKEIGQTPEQAYFIYPLIEESEILTEVKAATKEYQRLKNKIFPEFKLGLLHGKMKSSDKNKVISDFRNGEIDILVATSVVEVGMDIPNATIIAIEGADRFGLAQLHQLRGRVGRRDKEGYCLLFAEQETSRLKALEKYHLGLKLAEIDLKIRGMGEIYGTKQHGRLEFKAANFQDLEIIELARQMASEIVEKDHSLSSYPLLREKITPFLLKQVQPD